MNTFEMQSFLTYINGMKPLIFSVIIVDSVLSLTRFLVDGGKIKSLFAWKGSRNFFILLKPYIFSLIVFTFLMFFFYKEGMVCKDGTFSRAIGKQGACSGHGGVRSFNFDTNFQIIYTASLVVFIVADGKNRKLQTNLPKSKKKNKSSPPTKN